MTDAQRTLSEKLRAEADLLAVYTDTDSVVETMLKASHEIERLQEVERVLRVELTECWKGSS